MIAFILANSTDLDEMQHYALFHLGLHCLQKYSFWEFLNTKDYIASANRERSSSVVDSRMRGCGFEPYCCHINPCLVLFQPRKTHPNIIEKLLTGT